MAGRLLAIELWGNEGTKAALERLAKLSDSTPSELLKVLLLEKMADMEEEGIDTGLLAK
jgi:DUF1009 family protein